MAKRSKNIEDFPPYSKVNKRVCHWCGTHFYSTRKPKFCGDICRVYWNRCPMSQDFMIFTSVQQKRVYQLPKSPKWILEMNDRILNRFGDLVHFKPSNYDSKPPEGKVSQISYLDGDQLYRIAVEIGFPIPEGEPPRVIGEMMSFVCCEAKVFKNNGIPSYLDMRQLPDH